MTACLSDLHAEVLPMTALRDCAVRVVCTGVSTHQIDKSVTKGEFRDLDWRDSQTGTGGQVHPDCEGTTAAAF